VFAYIVPKEIIVPLLLMHRLYPLPSLGSDIRLTSPHMSHVRCPEEEWKPCYADKMTTVSDRLLEVSGGFVYNYYN
jgi:hypothetical protein